MAIPREPGYPADAPPAVPTPPMVASPPTAVVPPLIATAPPDLQQLRWGPIWAGLLMALGVFFLLSLAAIATGLQAAPGADEDDLGIVAVVATSVIAIVSFFVGGFVAAWSAGVADPGRALLNGFLVWTLWLAIVILLATLTTLVPYAYSAAAQAYLWLVERERFQPRKLVRDTVIALLAFAYSVWAIAGAGDDIVTKGFVLMLLGVPVYVGMRWWQRRSALTLPEEDPA